MASGYALSFLSIAAAALIGGNLARQEVKPLVETERKFCKTLTEVGLSRSFSQFFADGAVIFRPGPVDGKDFHMKHENNYKGLYWEADFAVMSEGKDFGYTAGPWSAMGKVTEGDTAWTYGHFFTVWQLIDGKWQALFDTGIDHAKMYDHDYRYKGATQKAEVKDKKWKDTAYTAGFIRGLEKEYAALCAEKGEKEAFAKFASVDARLNRDGEFPFEGREKSLGYLSKNNRNLVLSVIGVKAAPAGDIVFTYGTGELKDDSTKCSYMKVWKQLNDKWEVAMDVMLVYKK